jgi:divinyl protochlorophyllide a 8-vinyl-reductase
MSAAAIAATLPDGVGRIGPNAVIRLAEALSAIEGAQAVGRVFKAAGLEKYLIESPADMIDEREVAHLHRALCREVGEKRARTVGWIAGQRTADYLLRCRIPRPVQFALRCLPAGAASRVLSAAIASNAWTFVGSGAFSVRHGRPTIFAIADSPICGDQDSSGTGCDFHAATFERLYARLVHPQARVDEIECRASGAVACLFAITW